jgi:LCP family protein required for cell wall assembly
VTHADPGSRREPAQPVRHGRLRTPSPAGAIARFLGVALAVVLVSIVAVTTIAFSNLATQVSANAVDIGGTPPPPPPVLGAIDGGFNMLVVGTDNDANQGDDYGERDATLNDVNIVLHVSADHKTAVAISFPRDLVISGPACVDPTTGDTVSGAVSAQALNTAWERGGANGGLACVAATIEALTGMQIPYAADTSFQGVIEMTDAIGGVPVCLNEAIDDKDSGLDLPAGTSTISGSMALSFLRNRHGVGDGSDLSRIASTQQYLSSLVRTIKSSQTLTDVTKLYGLAQAASQNIELSSSLANVNTMVSLALTLKDVDLDNMVFVQYPAAADPDDINKVVPVRSTAAELMQSVLADQPFSLPPDSTGTGSTLADGSTATPTPDAGDGTGDGSGATSTPDPNATVAPTSTAPPVISGLTGQTAAEQTCANAFED